MRTETSPHQKNYIAILCIGGILSLVISVIDSSTNHVLSPDSSLYIFTAQTFLDHGLDAAVDSYRWPFLSILIAVIHHITGFSLTFSGHALIAFFYAGITCTFISLTRDLGGSNRTLILALLVIIIFPTLNDYRSYITRDAGFWLFTLLSLQQLLRFAIQNNLKHALGWLLFTIAAIGFRTEAIFFAALAPIALLSDKELSFKERIKKTSFIFCLLGCVAAVAFGIILSTPELSAKFRVVMELFNLDAFFQNLLFNFNNTLNQFSAIAENRHFAEDSPIIFISGLIALVPYTILHALTISYLVFLCWPDRKKSTPFARQRIYLLTYLLGIASYLTLYSFNKYFLTDRYALIAALILMLAVPFYIEAAWEQQQNSQRNFSWKKLIIILLLLYPALDSLVSSGSSKQYIASATDWVKDNKPVNSHLLTNEKHIAVLGANCFKDCVAKTLPELRQKANSKKFDLIAVKVRHKKKEEAKKISSLIASSDWTLVKSFSNEKEDKVLILSRKLHSTDKSQ